MAEDVEIPVCRRMNDADARGNRRTVRERMSGGVLLVMAGLVVTGCSARRIVAGAGEPGTTTILVENQVASPDELDRLLVTIDEAAVPLSMLPPRGEEPSPLTALRLAPGPHTISVRAATHGVGDGREVVASAQTFHVAAAAASIGIAVRSLPEGRIAVDLKMRGGHMAAPLGAEPPESPAQRCDPLQPTPRALCRAANDLDAAVRRNDLVGVLCVRDKLTTMRQLAAIGATADSQVFALSREVDRCVRNDVIGGADGTTVIKGPAAF
jgi:hypothetical protein